MFTNNYITWKTECFTSTSYSTSFTATTFTGVSKTIYIFGAEMQDIGTVMRKSLTGSIVDKECYRGEGGVCFGTGSTPATKDDYTLESPITSGITVTNPSDVVYHENDNGQYTFSASFVVANTSDAELNIWEVGVVSYLGNYCSTGITISGSFGGSPILFDRQVLSEPITIPAGESKLVTYKITFNQVLNIE